MSVGLVIVTHGESGADLRAEAEFILGESLEALRAVPFNHSAGQREEIYQIHSAIAAADSGDGVLVLTEPAVSFQLSAVSRYLLAVELSRR